MTKRKRKNHSPEFKAKVYLRSANNDSAKYAGPVDTHTGQDIFYK
jgi:transposase-like protein